MEIIMILVITILTSVTFAGSSMGGKQQEKPDQKCYLDFLGDKLKQRIKENGGSCDGLEIEGKTNLKYTCYVRESLSPNACCLTDESGELFLYGYVDCNPK